MNFVLYKNHFLVLTLLLGILFLNSNPGYCQSQGLSQSLDFHIENLPLGNTLDSLSQALGVPFSYSSRSLPLKKKVTFSASQQSGRKILTHILLQTDAIFKETENQVTIYVPKKFVTVSGYVVDATSGEKLLHAKVYDLKSKSGVLTNSYGFFSLQIPKDSIQLAIAYTTFKSRMLSFLPKKDCFLEIALTPDFELSEVTIIGENQERIEERVGMGTISIPIDQIKALPALLGEVDVVKALQLMPGIQSGREGSSGMYVRGGGPDQNLVLLDGVPLYYVSHLGGFFSIFNADALNGVELVKGGFPARFGGRLSSVLDIRMKEGNLKEFKGEAQFGLLASKISVQGPIQKDKTSFIVSARRTYFDLFVKPIVKLSSDGEDLFAYHFYDLNIKGNHIFDLKNRLYVSAYFGDDRTRTRSSNEVRTTGGQVISSNEYQYKVYWGNRMGAIRWNHIWGPKLFSNLTATFSRYRFDFDQRSSTVQGDASGINEIYRVRARYRSAIRDIGIKYDFDFYPNPQHDVKFGTNVIYHHFEPGINVQQITLNDSLVTTPSFGNGKVEGVEFYVYAEDEWEIHNRLKINAGLHLAVYNAEGREYSSFQPRISGRLLMTKHLSFKASYGKMAQFTHLLTNSDVGLPTDLWVPATDRVPPQLSNQTSAGFASTFGKNKYEFSVEGYYKKMKNLIDYKEGISFLGSTEDWQDKVETGGKGWAYGVEVLLQKKTGNTTGWVGYTLAWNNRQFENINDGKIYPFRYDRRHDVSVVVSHKLNKKVSLSATWVYGTGNQITLATARYSSPGSPLNDIDIFEGGKNGFSMRDYHRLDLGIRLHKETAWGERSWNLGLYNAYNRRNPYYYFFDNETAASGLTKTVLKQFSLFMVLPAVSYNMKF